MSNEAELVESVVRRLREIRELRGISQYRLAKETGLSPSGIRHMENGRVTPTLLFVLRICTFLRVDFSALVREVAGLGAKPVGAPASKSKDGSKSQERKRVAIVRKARSRKSR